MGAVGAARALHPGDLEVMRSLPSSFRFFPADRLPWAQLGKAEGPSAAWRRNRAWSAWRAGRAVAAARRAAPVRAWYWATRTRHRCPDQGRLVHLLDGPCSLEHSLTLCWTPVAGPHQSKRHGCLSQTSRCADVRWDDSRRELVLLISQLHPWERGACTCPPPPPPSAWSTHLRAGTERRSSPCTAPT